MYSGISMAGGQIHNADLFELLSKAQNTPSKVGN
jgi:hypothetical protein